MSKNDFFAPPIRTPFPDAKGDPVFAWKKWFQQVGDVVNDITFGNPSIPGNIDGIWITATCPAAPNTDFTVTHGLGRIPAGYIVAKKDRAVDLYTGGTAWTTSQMTLKASVGDAVVVLFAF